MAQTRKNRSLPPTGELALLLGAALVIAVFFFLRALPGPSGVARVFVNGELLLELPLERAEDGLISLREHGVPAELEVLDGKIRFVHVTCPDHICEKTGFIWKDGQTAVCMPNRASVTIAGG